MSIPTALTPGSVFARDYSIVRPLSEGGMGAVYVVQQLSTGAQRALKLMHPQLVREPRQRARFEQEARVGAQIESEHVVSVLSSGVDDASGLPWLVMELLSGQDLAQAIAERGALSLDDVRDILAQVTHAVAAAHRVGIVHRDLKPENIFLAVSHREGQTRLVKVLDFGIAKVVAEAKATATQALGTPIWMAPEQTEASRSITPAADVWALGLIAFRMLTGKHFWISANSDEATATMVLREVVIDAIVPASQRAREYGSPGLLPPGFDDWFSRCVVRDPTLRFPDAGAARAAFSTMFEGGHAGPVSAAMTVAMSPSSPGATVLAPLSGPSPGASGPAVFVAGALTAPAPASAASPALTPVPGVPLAPKSTPKRGSKTPLVLGALVALGVVVVSAGLVVRSAARSRTLEACDTETGEARLTACQEACAIDAKRACGVHGKLLLAKSDDAASVTATKSFEQACKALDYEACEKLGGLYETGVNGGAERSPAQALASYTKSCDGKNARGCGARGRLQVRSPKGGDGSGYAQMAEACEQKGDDISCADLAFALDVGKDRADLARSEAPFRKALPALRLACDAGETLACATLGYQLTAGRGVPRDAAMGSALLEKACARGAVDACHNQAAFALFTPEGPKNLAASSKAFQELCAAGSEIACNNNALLEAKVPVVAKQQHGLLHLVVGCSPDVSVGCSQAGPIFALPGEKPRDLPATKAALEKACDSGVGFACKNLAGLIEAGFSGPREAVRALAAYERGCKAGTLDRCESLGSTPFKPREVWKGTYVCGQGSTDVSIRVFEESVGDKPVKALFDFDFGQGKAAGRFFLAGGYDAANRGMTFTPGAWLERPANYGTVGMKGELSLDKTIFAGKMLDPRCGAFRLVKQTGDMVGTTCAKPEEAFVEGRGCVTKPRAGATALGTWGGKGTEANGSTWPMNATFTTLEDGLCGTVSYPSLGCTGDWYCRGSSDGKTVRAREIITTGIGKCDTTGSIEMTVADDGKTADWKWTSLRPGSTAKLTREK